MNAEFFGMKPTEGNESEAGCSKEVAPISSSGTVATRKHVLQVSTYQVN